MGYRDNGIMVIVNCGNCDTFQQGKFFKITDKYFNRHFPELCEADEAALSELKALKVLMKNRVFAPKPSFLPKAEHTRDLDSDLAAIDGRSITADSANAVSIGLAPLVLQLVQGNYTKGLKEIGFKRDGNALTVIFSEQDENHEIKVAFGEPAESTVSFHGDHFAVVSQGRFSENEDGVPVLTIDCEFIETPYSRRYKFYFDSNGIWAEFSESPGNMLQKVLPKILLTLAPKSEKLGNAVSKIDGDYIAIKVEKAFTQKILFKEEKKK